MPVPSSQPPNTQTARLLIQWIMAACLLVIAFLLFNKAVKHLTTGKTVNSRIASDYYDPFNTRTQYVTIRRGERFTSAPIIGSNEKVNYDVVHGDVWLDTRVNGSKIISQEPTLSPFYKPTTNDNIRQLEFRINPVRASGRDESQVEVRIKRQY